MTRTITYENPCPSCGRQTTAAVVDFAPIPPRVVAIYCPACRWRRDRADTDTDVNSPR